MGLKKLLLKHTNGDWDGRHRWPIVYDWADNKVAVLDVVENDILVVGLHVKELTGPETTADLDLSGAQALRCMIRDEQNPDNAEIIGYKTLYNQGDYAPSEDLENGKVTWKPSVGPMKYTINGVNTDSDTEAFYIEHDFSFQFKDGDILTVDGSTGNDGKYTCDGDAVYDVENDRTAVSVNEDITDATADGSIIHSVLQHLEWGNEDAMRVYIECSYRTSDGEEQTILPAFPMQIHRELGDYADVVASSETPSLVTFSEMEEQGYLQNQRVESGAADLTANDTDGFTILAVTDTSSPRTVTIASNNIDNSKQSMIVKDESGGAAQNNITVDCEGSDETIDGELEVTINENYGALIVYPANGQLYIQNNTVAIR